MWLMPSSTAMRSTARAPSLSAGGPNTPRPASCIAPSPIRFTVSPGASVNVPPSCVCAMRFLLVVAPPACRARLPAAGHTSAATRCEPWRPACRCWLAVRMDLTAKLQIKPGQTVAAVGMPDGVAPLAGGANPAAEPGAADAVVAFVRNRAELGTGADAAVAAALLDRLAWIAYP